VLELLYDLGSAPSSDPFPLPVLDRLGALVGAQKTGYGEFSFTDRGRSYVTQHRINNCTEPAWLGETVKRLWLQDPIVCLIHGRAVEPLAVSDRMSMRKFHRLEYFQQIHRPLGTADCVRLFLPAPNAMSRFFWFDQEQWGLKHRERQLLELLRPHFVLWRGRWTAPAPPSALGLTAREQEVLRKTAAGATNREIAETLWISPHTVRTHLHHIFEKLDVRTRTEAAALLRTGSVAAELSLEPPPFDSARCSGKNMLERGTIRGLAVRRKHELDR
jgi:DNA-binding CsgD family transcriptional regulator